MKFFLAIFVPILSLMANDAFQENTLQVTGRGEMRIQATVADIRFGIEAEGKRSSDAERVLADRLNQVLSLLKKEDVERVETSSFTVFPEYTNTNPPEIKSYRGRAEISLRASLDQAGGIIGRITESTTSHINGIELRAKDSSISEARQEALQKACDIALRAAQTVFNSLELEQKEIVGVTIHPMDQPPVIFRSKIAAFAEASAGPELQGEQTVDAQVTLYLQFREKS